MTTTKLSLDFFIKSDYLMEAFPMRTPEEQTTAFKQSLLDTLRYMQAIAYKAYSNPEDKQNISFAMQKYLGNLDMIQNFFESQVPNPTLVELIQANKKAFITAINKHVEFKPIYWNKNLEVGTEQLPPRYMNTATVPAPQYKGGSAFYPTHAPLTNKIELGK